MVMVKSCVFNEWVCMLGADLLMSIPMVEMPPLETCSTRARACSKMKHRKLPPVMATLHAKALLTVTVDHSLYGFPLCAMGALLRLSEEGRCYVLLRL